MAGIKAGWRLQYGKETTKGTKVAASKIWAGPAAGIEDARETVFVEEDIGLIAPRLRTYQPMLLAKYAMPQTEVTFEQLPVILSAAIKNVVSGVADGSGSGKVYAYPAHTDADSLNDFTAWSLEAGDNQQEEEMEYCFVADFTLSGKAGEAWKVAANWNGRQVLADSFTGGLAVPSVLETALFGKTKLFIDDSGGTLGSTQKTNTLLAAELKWKTGLVPKWTGDGQLHFSFAKFGPKPEIKLDVTFEHDGSATAEKTKWRAGATRLVQLKCEGSDLADDDTYTFKTLLINLAGQWESFAVLDADSDGDSIVTGTLRAGYSETDSLFAGITVVNEVASIP